MSETVVISDGGVRFALFLCHIDLTDAERDALLDVPGAVEAGTEGYQWDKVVFRLGRISALTQERVDQAVADITAVLRRFRPGIQVRCSSCEEE